MCSPGTGAGEEHSWGQRTWPAFAHPTAAPSVGSGTVVADRACAAAPRAASSDEACAWRAAGRCACPGSAPCTRQAASPFDYLVCVMLVLCTGQTGQARTCTACRQARLAGTSLGARLLPGSCSAQGAPACRPPCALQARHAGKGAAGTAPGRPPARRRQRCRRLQHWAAPALALGPPWPRLSRLQAWQAWAQAPPPPCGAWRGGCPRCCPDAPALACWRQAGHGWRPVGCRPRSPAAAPPGAGTLCAAGAARAGSSAPARGKLGLLQAGPAQPRRGHAMRQGKTGHWGFQARSNTLACAAHAALPGSVPLPAEQPALLPQPGQKLPGLPGRLSPAAHRSGRAAGLHGQQVLPAQSGCRAGAPGRGACIGCVEQETEKSGDGARLQRGARWRRRAGRESAGCGCTSCAWWRPGRAPARCQTCPRSASRAPGPAHAAPAVRLPGGAGSRGCSHGVRQAGAARPGLVTSCTDPSVPDPVRHRCCQRGLQGCKQLAVGPGGQGTHPGAAA